MRKYCFYRHEGVLTITRDNELYCTGKIIPSISTYRFTLDDISGNSFEMIPSGLFLWRKITLYKNGELIERYSPKKALQSNVHLDSRLFIRKNGEYMHHIDRGNINNTDGNCRFSWAGTPEDIEMQVICLVILHYIGSTAGLYACSGTLNLAT